jgi:hypothetical protein
MAYEDGVFATFYDDALKNESKTRKEGVVVFDDVLMIKIQVPNQIDCVPRPATENDKTRFPKSWQAYVTGKEPEEEGFPLEQWPQMTTGELKVCQANMIKTVEQLAETPDANIHRLGQGGMSMKTRAQKFLAGLGEKDLLRKENTKLKKRLDKLESKLERALSQQEDNKKDIGKVERKTLRVANT